MKFSWLVIILWSFLAISRAENVQSSKILIVGAGAAGIAAAAKLIENNITDIIILEADGKIGGRIHTVQFGDGVVDLGAQWIYSEKENIGYDLVKDMNLLEPDPATMTAYYSSHNYLNPNFVSELYKIFYQLYFGHNSTNQETSVGDYIIPRYEEAVLEKYKEPQKHVIANEILEYFLKGSLLSDGAFSWFDASIKRDQKVDKDSINYNWKGNGFKTILDVLMKKYPDPKKSLNIEDKLLLNKEVTRIRWKNIKNSFGVIVECADGSKYIAEHVILTMSLGVLKNKHVTLFHPRLPLKKQKAIKSIGMGAIQKVFLRFPSRWWPKDNFTDFSFVWNQTDLSVLTTKTWLSNLLGVDAVKHNNNVLLAWFCGESVPKIELLSDKMVREGIMFVLRKFVGHMVDNMTDPVEIIRHNWYSDNNFRGAYSFQTKASRKYGTSQELVLSEPIITKDSNMPILLFAGEATHPTHYATVHGAIESGQREANRIIDFYKSQT